MSKHVLKGSILSVLNIWLCLFYDFEQNKKRQWI